MAGYLVYLRWDVRGGWKHSQGEARPYKYATNQLRFQPVMGDTVWVVACPRWGGERLPPSLVARLEVTRGCVDLRTAHDVTPEERAFRAYGRYLAVSDEEHGEYFPTNNLYDVLMRLEFQGGRRLASCTKCNQAQLDPGEPFYAHVPTHLQTVRLLTEGDEALLKDHAQAVQLGKIFFISYRHADVEAQEPVRLFASLLREQRAAYWLDEEMIRYQGSGEGRRIPTEKLEQMLSDGVRQAVVFAAFVSPTYAERVWIQYELAQGERFHNEGHLERRIAIYLAEGVSELSDTEGWEVYRYPQAQAREFFLSVIQGASRR